MGMKRSTTRALVSYMGQFDSAHRESCLKHWKHDKFPRIRIMRTFSEEAVIDAFGRQTLTHIFYQEIKTEVSDQ